MKNRVLLHTGLVLNSLYSTVDLFIPYACSFFDLFNTDDHIDRVYKELKEVCFIFIIMYINCFITLCVCTISALNSLMPTFTVASGLIHFNLSRCCPQLVICIKHCTVKLFIDSFVYSFI